MRVIYLPKDRHAILEISGELYLKYVASPPPVGVLVIESTDQHLVSFPFEQCNIFLPIRAGQNHRTHSRGTIYHHTNALSHLMKLFVLQLLLPSLYSNQPLGILYHSLDLFFKPQYFTKPWNFEWFSVFGCMKKQLYLISCCMSCSQIGNT